MKNNKDTLKRLFAQAKEADDQGLKKLSEAVTLAITDNFEIQDNQYSYTQLKEDIYKQLWKSAASVIKYYDLGSVDVAKVDKFITVLGSELLKELEDNLNKDSVIKGPFESDLPGEK